MSIYTPKSNPLHSTPINNTPFQKNDVVVPAVIGSHLFRNRPTLTAKVIRVNTKKNTVTLDFKCGSRYVVIPNQPMLRSCHFKGSGLPFYFAVHAKDYVEGMYKTL